MEQYKQESYYITCKDNEYYQVLDTIDYLLEKAINEDNYPVWGETLEILKNQLVENEGENINPWQYNMIITILLDFVPDNIKI